MPSTCSKGEKLKLQFDEPERYLRLERRIRDLIREHCIKLNLHDLNIPTSESVVQPEMAEQVQNRPLKCYAIPLQDEQHSNIAAPAIESNNFELKPSLLSAVQQNQFSGSPTEDPNLHLSVFLQYVDTVEANGVSPEAIRLCLFPFSLRDRARAWL